MQKFKKIIKNILKWLLLDKLSDKDYSFQVKKNDMFIISYPKSGNTWMRFLLSNIIKDDEINFVNVERTVIDIYKTKNSKIKHSQKYNIFKSHSPFNFKFSSNKVVYIVRDVRDVVISYYYHTKKGRNVEIEFEEFFKMFLDGNVRSEFGNWGEHVGSWLGAKSSDTENFLIIKYENLLQDTFTSLKTICNFLNLDASDAKIEKAVEQCKFDKLKKDEIKFEDVAIETKNTRKDIKFFRKGTSGQWKDVLTEDQLNKLYEKFGTQMKLLDYL